MRTPEEWTVHAREVCETLDPVTGQPTVHWEQFAKVVDDIVGTSQQSMTAEFVAALRASDFLHAHQRCENCAAFRTRPSTDEPSTERGVRA